MPLSPETEALLARMKAEEEIRCPYCNHLQPTDDSNYPVTYWAEDGVTEMDCEDCNKTFYVEERVRRTYGVGKTREEARGEEPEEGT